MPDDIPPDGDDDDAPGSEDKDLFEDSEEVEDPANDAADDPQPQEGAEPQEDAEPQEVDWREPEEDDVGWGRDRPGYGDLPLPLGDPSDAEVSDPGDVTLESLEQAQRRRVEVRLVHSLTISTVEARRASSAASKHSVCAVRASTRVLGHFAEATTAVSRGTAATSAAVRAASSA